MEHQLQVSLPLKSILCVDENTITTATGTPTVHHLGVPGDPNTSQNKQKYRFLALTEQIWQIFLMEVNHMLLVQQMCSYKSDAISKGKQTTIDELFPKGFLHKTIPKLLCFVVDLDYCLKNKHKCGFSKVFCFSARCDFQRFMQLSLIKNVITLVGIMKDG